ncbi:TrbC/VirB2 family protein [Legionella erythra]|uniref:Vir protein n=1 Tax=Legionella erythra TaxID=448 RepID=A0A0W0TRL5_LEGER|nr:TrbC/VirB2 family protein [Legionella erythra]KTC98223.1 vir protein [Legionella erythra]
MHRLGKKIARLHQHLLWGLVLAPTTSFATDLESVLDGGIRFFQGSIARLIGILVIIGCGYLCLEKQKFPKERFVIILVGLGIIFGGTTIYGQLAS